MSPSDIGGTIPICVGMIESILIKPLLWNRTPGVSSRGAHLPEFSQVCSISRKPTAHPNYRDWHAWVFSAVVARGRVFIRHVKCPRLYINQKARKSNLPIQLPGKHLEEFRE